MLPPEEEELSRLQGSPGNGDLPLALGVCCLNGQSLCQGYDGVTWEGELRLGEKEISTEPTRWIAVNRREPRRLFWVNSSQISCHPTQLQVPCKLLFKQQ